MATRPIDSVHAAAAAGLVRTLRAREGDLVDPWPPALEAEMLADMGARGQGEPAYPRVALDDAGQVVGYAAIDCSAALRRAHALGPLVHPDHRRRGLGRALMVDLLDCARKARQKFLRATVGATNEAAAALLAAFGFRKKDTHACLRLPRPRALAESTPPAGIELRRVGPDQVDAYFAFTRSLLPRQERQTRALLKAEHYVAICAWREGSPIACVEVDLRYDDVATVEQLEAPPSLLAKGFGNTLLLEAARHAFGDERIQALDLVMKGADPARREALAKSGFTVRHELVSHDLRL